MAKYQSLESSIRKVVADTLRELEESVQQSEAEDAKCGEGQYWCNTDQKCKPIPDGMKVDGDGMLVKEEVEQAEGFMAKNTPDRDRLAGKLLKHKKKLQPAAYKKHQDNLTSNDPKRIKNSLDRLKAMESVEQVNELSKDTLGSYVKKASQSATDHGAEYGRKKADQDSVNRSLNRHGVSSQDKDDAHKAFKTTDSDVRAPEKKASKRLKGISTAVKKLTKEEEVLEQKNCGCGQDPCKTFGKVDEKTLTPAEKKKREDVAKAIERDNPDMPMDKKMAIATATAKKVAESSISDRTRRLIEKAIKRNT